MQVLSKKTGYSESTEQSRPEIEKGDVVLHGSLRAHVAWVNSGGKTAAILYFGRGSFFPPPKWKVNVEELTPTTPVRVLTGGQELFF